MADGTDRFAAWLKEAHIAEDRLSAEQRAVLEAGFRFRQQQGSDYYANRVLGHFLLHCQCGLKVAQIARLVGISRPTASRQQGLSAKQAIQQAHHRLDGRPYGKLLPRYAGPIAAFLLRQPQATRADLIDFVDQTWGVRVSRIALYKFLRKYGLDRFPEAPAAAVPANPRPPVARRPAETLPAVPPQLASVPPFGSRARSTRVPS